MTGCIQGTKEKKILAFLAFLGWGNSDTRTGKKRGLGSGFADQEVWKVSQDQKERGVHPGRLQRWRLTQIHASVCFGGGSGASGVVN